MNFQTLSTVPNSKQMLEEAFRKAREQADKKSFKGEWIQKVKQNEATKLDVFKNELAQKLQRILKEFPDSERLPRFYNKLLRLTLDYDNFKKSLGGVNWVLQKLRFFHRFYASKIAREKNGGQIKVISKESYGRISSLIKQIDSNLLFLEQSRRVMKTYPDIKDMFTVCLYGFPNVGKTTILNKLTFTRAQVANYAFTTTSINAGYIELEGKKVQVLDVPGTLARPVKMNNIEKQADLVLYELAKAIIFVLDPSGYSGYTVEEQEELLQRLKKQVGPEKPIFLYLSKTDLVPKEDIIKWEKKALSFEDIKEKLKKLRREYIEVAPKIEPVNTTKRNIEDIDDGDDLDSEDNEEDY
ncbi:50S ribosome-binding GTPase [Candidatus Woesearchaeota archaeon]|nr:50S ribosome-binding GTPase [Candidatus Woesearchaeota archaeon]